MILKNVKHEAFCQAMAQGKTQSESYILAGYKTTPENARKHAFRLMTNGGLIERLKELRKAVEVTDLISVTEVINDINSTMVNANADDQYAVVMKGVELKAKILGMLVTRSEDTLKVDANVIVENPMIAEIHKLRQEIKKK